MNRNVLTPLIVFAGLAIQMWTPATAAPPRIPTRSLPLAVLTSSDSQIRQLKYGRIISKSAWAKAWLDHLGKNAERQSLEIDFGRCCVIAIFGGESINSSGFTVESVRDAGDTTVLRFDRISYQAAGPGGGAEHVTPYAFIVLPKTDKTIVLEEDVQIGIGEPPIWKEVARLLAK